ncbi:hypothetical protein EG329_005251 [Mollisiaceae sp. DMI_Dod_QoI]|nr:hypothetical protein EG329_005251 [Helotiales sp. DMI_Dod_QoI]
MPNQLGPSVTHTRTHHTPGMAPEAPMAVADWEEINEKIPLIKRIQKIEPVSSIRADPRSTSRILQPSFSARLNVPRVCPLEGLVRIPPILSYRSHFEATSNRPFSPVSWPSENLLAELEGCTPDPKERSVSCPPISPPTSRGRDLLTPCSSKNLPLWSPETVYRLPDYTPRPAVRSKESKRANAPLIVVTAERPVYSKEQKTPLRLQPSTTSASHRTSKSRFSSTQISPFASCREPESPLSFQQSTPLRPPTEPKSPQTPSPPSCGRETPVHDRPAHEYQSCQKQPDPSTLPGLDEDEHKNINRPHLLPRPLICPRLEKIARGYHLDKTTAPPFVTFSDTGHQKKEEEKREEDDTVKEPPKPSSPFLDYHDWFRDPLELDPSIEVVYNLYTDQFRLEKRSVLMRNTYQTEKRDILEEEEEKGIQLVELLGDSPPLLCDGR